LTTKPKAEQRRAVAAACAGGLALCGALALGWTAPAAAQAGLQDKDKAAAATIDIRLHDSRLMDARAALLARAEAELARGDAAAATETFDRAAMMLHAPDTEMGLVRSYMQAGHYRRALAFCAHTAGVHREASAAGALYAWLLQAGGQGAFAERTLKAALERAPQDAVLLETRRALAAPLPTASAALLQTRHRMAPQPVMLGGQPAVPADARVVASGVLLAGGTLALVPRSAVVDASPQGAPVWVRNGLGQTTRAQIAATDQKALNALGVALLRLEAPLDASAVAAGPAPREPFAGSPGFALQYAAGAASSASASDAGAAWPWLSQGFFGTLPAQPDRSRRLGLELAAGPYGGPVFDAQGRLAGMAVPGPQGEALMLSATRWQGLPGMPTSSAVQDEAVSPPRGTAPADEVYESGLRVALQVIALR
jgi:tetratricopeptide (TPR) repeat protein